MTSVSYTIPGLHVTDHEVEVPLDWASPHDGRTLTVFARELVAPSRRHDDLPLVVFLQGGPGGKGPRPTAADGWVGQMLATHRVVLLDQRGTGRSSAVRGAALAALGTPTEQAAYLAHFRADSIVDDAEHLRKTVYGGRRWATVGQSYGGFLTLTYLSRASHALTACYVTGGLPSIWPDTHEVYRRTYARTAAKNAQYYERFPQDVERVARIADRLDAGDVRLPDGDVLSTRRFQTVGMDFGMKPGFERVHWLVDEAFDRGSDDLSDTFLEAVMDLTSYRSRPLYAVLHESIYASGEATTGWAAHTVRAEHPAFDPSARPLLFSGEMIYPWMFEEISGLRPFQAAAEELAARSSWTTLYDPDVLASNEVPVAAAVYHDDMFVDAQLSLATAAHVGSVQTWVTNEFEHDGLRTGDVLSRLVRLVADQGGPRPETDEPSSVRGVRHL